MLSITTSERMLDEARPYAVALVQREERRTGSRMAAYEGVASRVGVSSSWLRKLIGRQDGLSLRAHEFFNLVSVYRSLCERIEAEADRERRVAASLRGKADETLESIAGVAVRPPGPQASGTGSPAAGATSRDAGEG